MITDVRLRDFKSFRDTRLTVGPFTIVVGTNASGKSNIRDVFRFLHGIGRGYSLPEIIGGHYGAGGQVEWAQMRGAANEIIRFGQGCFQIDVGFKLKEICGNYHITVERNMQGRGGFRVTSEALTRDLRYEPTYTSHPGGDDPVADQDDVNQLMLRMARTEKQKKLGYKFSARPDQPALSQIDEFKNAGRLHKVSAQEVMDLFAGIRFLDLVPDLMRKPAFPGQAILGDSGDNLPTALQSICTDTARKAILMEWIRELTPMDVVDFEFPVDPITGLVQLTLKEGNGTSVSAYSASDGTLRFLAMLASLLGENRARVYFFEEIDNGIHPARLRLLLDLIEQQTRQSSIQVVTTTHSPDLLSMISDDTFENTSVVYRSPEANESRIKRVMDLPHAKELRASQGLGRLHASGWMEDVLALLDSETDAPAP